MVLYFIILPIFFFLISVKLGQKDFLHTVSFILGLHVFLKIILFKIIPHIAFASGIFINITIIYLFVYYLLLTQLSNDKYVIIYLSCIIGLFVYLFVLAVYRGDDPVTYMDYVKNYFFNFLLFTIFLSERVKKKYPIKTYIKFIIALTFIQALLGILQYYIPEVSDFFKIVTYERYGKTELAIAKQFQAEQVLTGTLIAMQNLSSFLLMNIIFLASLKHFNVCKLDNSVYWVILLSIITMLLTGVRAPILGLFIGIFAILWFRNKKLFFGIIIVAFIILPLILASISSLIKYSTTAAAGGDFENPLIRLLGIFAIFDTSLLENTTLSRSLELAEYLFQNPLFGFGPGFIFAGYSFSDAFLILLTIEFGLFGVFILILPYIIVLRIIKNRRTKKEYTVGIILFITALSQSIVNEGLWTWYTNLQFFFMVMILLRVNVKKLNYKLKLV